MILLTAAVDLLSSLVYTPISDTKGKKRMDDDQGISSSDEPVELSEPEMQPHIVRAPVRLIGEKPNIAKQAIGYYVDKKHFGTKLAQAQGFARNRVHLFGRRVEVKYVAHDGVETIVEIFEP